LAGFIARVSAAPLNHAHTTVASPMNGRR
jgi:hypothetical protein